MLSSIRPHLFILLAFPLPLILSACSGNVSKSQIIQKAQVLEAIYIGASTCAQCHKEQYDKWAKTKHAEAMIDLILSGDNHNIRCLRCHTTGLKPNLSQPGQFTYLENIQCEACHGPGSLHVVSTKSDKSSTDMRTFSDDCSTCIMKVCMECHNVSCSSHFTLEHYLGQIAH